MQSARIIKSPFNFCKTHLFTNTGLPTSNYIYLNYFNETKFKMGGKFYELLLSTNLRIGFK